MDENRRDAPQTEREKAMEIVGIMQGVPESEWDKLKYAAIGMAMLAGKPVHIAAEDRRAG